MASQRTTGWRAKSASARPNSMKASTAPAVDEASVSILLCPLAKAKALALKPCQQLPNIEL